MQHFQQTWVFFDFLQEVAVHSWPLLLCFLVKFGFDAACLLSARNLATSEYLESFSNHGICLVGCQCEVDLECWCIV